MNKEVVKLKSLLKERYDDLLERWEDIEEKGENPFDEWNAFLNGFGLVKSVSYECNWHPECGIPHLLDVIEETMNGDIPVYMVDFDNGSNMSHTYFFDRDKARKALQ